MSRRHAVAAGLVALPVVAALAAYRSELAGVLQAVFAWIDGVGPWAPAVYVAISALAIVLFLPAAPFYMAAGILFGLIAGTAWAFAAAVVAGGAAFLIARYLARERLEERLRDHDALEAVDRAVRREGLRAALLIRCSPILPSSLINYGLGLSGLRFRHHLVASVAALPGTFLYVYYGKALGDLTSLLRGGAPERGPAYYALLIAGMAATVLATRQITVRARRLLESDGSDRSHASGD